MHVPRSQIAHLYEQLQRSTHPLSPPVLVLTALNVDALCATRIFTALLRRDYIQHKVQPVAGYSELRKAGVDLVLPLTRQRGGDGGLVVCLGLGGMIDLEEILGLDGALADGGNSDMSNHGVETWVIDARRPWNLTNVFGISSGDLQAEPQLKVQGIEQGRILPSYRSGKGGIIVWDDGGIEEELQDEREAYMALLDMPDIVDDDIDRDEDSEIDTQSTSHSLSRKRKTLSENADDDDNYEDMDRPHQRRRSNSSSSLPVSHPALPSGRIIHSTPPPSSQAQQSDAPMPSSPPQPSQRQLRRKLLKLRRKHEATLEAYYGLGTSASEPVSSMLYSLASELGREDNELLWLAIVGITSIDLSPLSQAKISHDQNGRRLQDRTEQVREILRDEVRRLNPVPEADLNRYKSQADIMPTRARSPTDYAIRLSPEPRFMLIRHWSLIDSMMHSTYLSTRLHVWSDAGKQRLNKLLAKMGISLQEAGKSYAHMDVELKQSLRRRLLKFAPQYNLEGLVPGEDGRRGHEGWGFVRSWGWKATFSAMDVAIISSAILEVGPDASHSTIDMKFDRESRDASYNDRLRTLPTPPASDNDIDASTADEGPDWTTRRFYAAYDALCPASSSASKGPTLLNNHISTAQYLARAILRCGAALMAKNQIRHLRSFRMAVVKEGPDVGVFVHPGALVKLAAWVSEALQVLEAERGRRNASDEALVLGCLDEARGVYVVVAIGGAGARKKVRTKAEIRQREEKKKRVAAERIANKAERARKREEARRLQRERDEANGLLDSDDEQQSEATESEASDTSSGSDDESDDEVLEARKQRGYGLNRFGQAFQEVVQQTGARVRIDSFEHSVVEIQKEDLSGFLENLSSKVVVG